MMLPWPLRILEPCPLFDNKIFEFGDTDGQYEFSSLEAVQRAALVMYGRFVAHINNVTADDDDAATKTQYLTLAETEQIVREHAHIFEDEYAIGGDTAEEANDKVRELMYALMDRIMSNVLHTGVNKGLLECSFDSGADDFVFSPTDGGIKIAKTYMERLRSEPNSGSIDD